jgi:hypothetical protein
MIDKNTPVWQLTVGEFLSLMEQNEPKEPIKLDSKYVYGIRGLAKLLNCSTSTAQNIKNSGKINKAIIPVGRNLAFEAEKVMELLKTKKHK